ncbi:MAG: hypothetical protein WD696_09310 [Bryobacteraceae bacterium]
MAGCLYGQTGPSSMPDDTDFRWRPALLQSTLFTLIEHGARLAQQGTREELRGPFFKDYFTAVRGLGGWDDGDPFIANYIAHPLQGAVSGYIQIQNDPKGMSQEFGRSREYWKSRLRSMLWSTAYSFQFEMGPLSEAAIGNIGKKPGTMAAVDLVVTPLGGLGWLTGEDALDRYVIARLEGRYSSLAYRAILRTMLNPSRAMANLLRMRAPWHRDTRDGITRIGKSLD